MRKLQFVGSMGTLLLALVAAPLIAAEDEATHEEVSTITVKGENGAGLQTLTATADGKIAALISAPRYAAPNPSGNAPVPEVRIYTPDGKESAKWKLPFLGQSIGVGPDGVIYVAGDGQVAKYTPAGKLLAQMEVPHLAEVLKDKEKLRIQAEEQVKEQVASIEQTLKEFNDQATQLRDKGEDKLTDEEKQQLAALDINIKAYESFLKNREQISVESTIAGLTARLRIINSISATEKDVFIACGELKGYGYAVWRMDHDFKNPSQVMGKLSGCCGQMDVQAAGESLYVAENTKHRVGQYDRSGKLVTSFGKRARESAGEEFGGCCNPMNCRIMGNGDVYTAESEGVVKKFNKDGEFVALIGVAKLTGGCKNVAVAASPSGDHVYFCDLPGSRIIILGKKGSAKTAAGG